MDIDPYAVLGVSPDASRDEIRRAHRELSTFYGSQRAGEDAAERLQQVNEAYQLLASATRRRSHDRAREADGEDGRSGAPPAATALATRTEPRGIRQELLGENDRHRRTLVRMVLMYAPLTLGVAVLALVPLFSFLDGRGGAAIPLVILGAIGLALAFQGITAIRDLRAQHTFTRGEVQRIWSKGGLLWFFRSHFMMVNRQVFVVPPEMWVLVEEGEVVECHHWPHTRTVIAMWSLRGEDEELRALDPEAPLIPL